MAREQANAAFQSSSFLYGGNAAYIEDLYGRYEKDPASVEAEWRDFFSALQDDPETVKAEARGAPGERPDWPIHAEWRARLGARRQLGPDRAHRHRQAEGEGRRRCKAPAPANGATAGASVSEAAIQQAARDSVRAIMMIRAFRMRGHLHADLDPLASRQPPSDHEELHPSSYGFTEADYDRKIFIDNVLGLEFATVPEMLAILKRTYCSTLGVEFMHISDPTEKAWIQARIEGRTRRSPSPTKARRRSSTS